MATIEFTTEELAAEEWRPVVGWEGRYEVSNLGRVRTLLSRPRIRRVNPNKGGYLRLTMRAPFGTRSVHILVAEAFIGPRPAPPPGCYRIEVNHKDGIKANCRLSNLEYLTQLENGQHASRMGLRPTGDRHGRHTHPESAPRGTRSGAYTHPERLARGDRNGLRLHPESVCRGEASTSAKLTAAAVLAIRARLDAGEYQEVIAADFGIGQTQVSRINRRESWAHLP